jgi:hypothetical protein
MGRPDILGSWLLAVSSWPLQGILEDNGFTGGLTVSLRKNVDLSASYEHSVRQSLDIAEVGISFHWGKVRNAGVE